MSAATAQRYAFDRVFSAEPVFGGPGRLALVDEVERLRSELVAVRMEKEMAAAEAFAEGRAAALVELRVERDTALLSAVDALGAGLEAMEARFAETEAGVVQEAAQVALEAADHLAGRALAIDPALAVDQAIGRALEQVRRGTPLVVRINPELLPELERHLSERQSGERRKLEVSLNGDLTLAIGDAQFDWDGGRLVLDAAARRLAIQAELDGLFA